jgi:hypothetical protein
VNVLLMGTDEQVEQTVRQTIESAAPGGGFILSSACSVAPMVEPDRLKRLVEAGVFERRQYCEHPPRFEYRLTPMGVALSPALVALMRWGDDWLSADDGPPTVLVHEACGEPLDQAFVCWTCDQTFTQSDIASRPGEHYTPTGTP